jgi:hypothetical protein
MTGTKSNMSEQKDCIFLKEIFLIRKKRYIYNILFTLIESYVAQNNCCFRCGRHPLRGEVGGGWALEIMTFLGPVQWQRAERRLPFGAQKSRDRVESNLYIYVIKSPIQLVNNPFKTLLVLLHIALSAYPLLRRLIHDEEHYEMYKSTIVSWN